MDSYLESKVFVSVQIFWFCCFQIKWSSVDADCRELWLKYWCRTPQILSSLMFGLWGLWMCWPLALNCRHYDVLEHRVPSGLVVDYQNLLSQCEELYEKFLNVRNSISSNDSDSEAENVSMVEGLKLYDKVEHLKQKLKLIENPLLR